MEDKVNSLKLPAQSYPAMEKVCLSGGDKNVYMWGHYLGTDEKPLLKWKVLKTVVFGI